MEIGTTAIFCVLAIAFMFVVRSKNAAVARFNLLEQSLAARSAEAIAALTSNEYLKRRVSSLESEHSKYSTKLVDYEKQIGYLNSKLKDQEAAHLVKVREERTDAVNRSRSVIKGQISEEMVPMLPGFPYQLSDCKFIGKPIDYIVFEGMSDGELTGITMLDVKTGSARLNKVQRQARDIIKSGKVYWKTLDPSTLDALSDSPKILEEKS